MDESGPTSYTMLVIGSSLVVGDLAALCARADEAMRDSAAPMVLCDVGALVRPDLAALNVLARVRIHVVRAGGTLRLWRAGPRLRLLLELTGLRSVLLSHPAEPEPIVKPGQGDERWPI